MVRVSAISRPTYSTVPESMSQFVNESVVSFPCKRSVALLTKVVPLKLNPPSDKIPVVVVAVVSPDKFAGKENTEVAPPAMVKFL